MNKKEKMKAVVYRQAGSPQVLEYAEWEKPVAVDAQVVINVKACGINALDAALRAAENPQVTLPHILGSDISGVVEAVGEDVDDWQPGDAVMVNPLLSCGTCHFCLADRQNLCQQARILGYQSAGGYAQYALVPAANLVRKPENISFIQAAALPLAGMTAHHMLFSKSHLKAGEKVLVLGASGGVGSMAVQLCKAAGAEVFALVGSAQKAEKVEALGADFAINYHDDGWPKQVCEAAQGKTLDLVVDPVGGSYISQSLDLLAAGGRLITLGSSLGGKPSLDSLRPIYKKQLTLTGSFMGSLADLQAVIQMVAHWRVAPLVDRIFPLEEAAFAHQYYERGQHFGKIVLQVV